MLFLLFLCFACEKENELEKEIQKMDVEVEVVRFDQKIASAKPKDLPELKKDFPFLFPKQYPDSLWAAKLSDTIQLEIDQEVAKAFPDFSKEKDELHELFQHIKYYFPEFKSPTVITVTSEVDYENKVVVADSLLLISLDTYLGKEHFFYHGIQEFLKKNFEPSQIIPDVAAAYAEQLVPRPEGRQFLDHMIYYGKILYLKDILIPNRSDAEKLGYTTEEMEWAKANEEQIWRYFVDNKLIFDTNSQLHGRFLYPAPFSKFYLELDAESPDRLGQYIGWQVVRDFMKKNEVSVKQLLITDAEKIFKESNYKPRQ